MALLVAAVALVWRATYEPGERPRGDRPPDDVVGARAAGAGRDHAGARDDRHRGGPARGRRGHRRRGRAGLDWRGADTLDWAIHQHGALATFLGLAAVGVWFLARARGADEQVRNALTAVCVLMACQGFVGATQYALELPAEIVWFHVVLAALTWLVAAVGDGRRRAVLGRGCARGAG